MKKTLALLLGLSLTGPAWAQCRMTQETVTKGELKIEERSQVRRDVLSEPTGRACWTRHRVRIGPDWHDINGRSDWLSSEPIDRTCARAVQQAEQDLIRRLGQSQVTQRQALICDDDDRFRRIQETQVGTVANLEQYRLHPDYPKKFYHNGTQCRWILDSSWNGRDVQTQQGIVCEVSRNRWVVVDKF